MAKKGTGPNKSQAIRDYYAANPNAKPKEVSAELKKQGVDVTPAFISTIRSTSMKKPKSAKRSVGRPAGSVGRPPGRPAGRPAGRPPKTAKTASASTGSAGLSIDGLIKAKSLVRELGGIDNAMATLAALKKLAD